MGVTTPCLVPQLLELVPLMIALHHEQELTRSKEMKSAPFIALSSGGSVRAAHIHQGKHGS